MTYKEKMNLTTDISPIGYLGAAIFGLVLSTVMYCFSNGMILTSGAIYVVYALIVFVFIGRRCDEKDCEFACEFNSFWITLEEFIARKLMAN